MEEPTKNPPVLGTTPSALRFLKQQPGRDQSEEAGESTVHENRNRPYAGHQAPSDYGHRRQFEPMAADRFGEELGPDAAIWTIYLEEAQEYDQELVKGRQQSLDTLLLFAALFSAILTAFLIESKDLLEQDPADVTVALLLTIAQSQQRVELGLPAPEGATPVTIPSFESSMTARWINGIWFTSLGLSLSVALMAMLAKEWLLGYLAFRPRSPRKLAFIRQSRLKGLEDWWALHIIALLPTLLHIALLLFAIGLVIYLWTLEQAVAAVMTGVIGLTLAFYLVTAVLGAVYEFCPFVTEISAYTRKMASSLFGSANKDRHDNGEASAPSIHDLEALLWLVNNAQDPVAIDSSYQAMAGLHVSPFLGPGTPELEFQWARISTYAIEGKTIFETLLYSIMKRFNELLEGTLDSRSIEPPVGRYINAMLGLVSRFPRDGTYESEVSVSRIFSEVGKLWQSNLPSRSMSGNTFASALIAEMDIFRIMTDEIIMYEAPKTDRESHNLSHVIHLMSTRKTLVSELPGRIEQWLNLSHGLIVARSQGRTHIDSYLLDGLYKAVGSAPGLLDQIVADHESIISPVEGSARFISNELKNPSTFPIDISPTPQPVESDLDRLYDLISVLWDHILHFKDTRTITFIESLKAYYNIAPIILQRLAGHNRRGRQAFNSWSRALSPPTDRELSRQELPQLTARYLMLTAGSMYPLLPNSTRKKKSTFSFALFIVFEAAKMSVDDFGESAESLAYHLGDFINILEFGGASEANLACLTWFDSDRYTPDYVCLIGGFYSIGRDLFPLATYTPPTCTLTLLRILARTEILVDDSAATLLNAIVAKLYAPGLTPDSISGSLLSVPVQYTPIEQLQQFTHDPHCFSALVDAARDIYEGPVLSAIIEIVQLAANRDSRLVVEDVQLDAAAVPGFLQALSWALPRSSERTNEQEKHREFVVAAAILLVKAGEDTESRRLLVEDFNRQTLLEELRSDEKGYADVISQPEWERLVNGLAF